MGVPLYVICCFSLAAFNICSLCLIFVFDMCLGVFCLGFILFGTMGFLDLGDNFLPHFREVFNYYLLKYFLMVFLFVFFFGTLMIRMLGCLTLSQRSLRLSSFLLILFLFSFLLHLFLPFYLLPHLLYLLPPLFCWWFPPECF